MGTSMSQDLRSALRSQLLRLAKLEDDRAADERATVPYWQACPPSVDGHHEAARLLRAEADNLLIPLAG